MGYKPTLNRDLNVRVSVKAYSPCSLATHFLIDQHDAATSGARKERGIEELELVGCVVEGWRDSQHGWTKEGRACVSNLESQTIIIIMKRSSAGFLLNRARV